LAASGHATALLARLPAIAFGDSGDPLPADFLTYPSWIAHVAPAMFLAGVIAVPMSAALYHQLIGKDRLFGRMVFGSALGKFRKSGAKKKAGQPIRIGYKLCPVNSLWSPAMRFLLHPTPVACNGPSPDNRAPVFCL
jgi:hypothetical protein